MKKIFIIIFIITHNYTFGQCVNSNNIYSFNYDGRTYQVVKENKSWIDAATCAVERGGMLAEINDANEQNAIYTELNSNANITTSNTIASDGGGGAYVWIGGNDISIEGNWVWDGNNDNNSTQFWQGTSTGSAINGLYNNWGNEPDDYFGQDALALSLNGWPLGTAGQWNDVDDTNTLYYIIEYSTVLSTLNPVLNNIDLYVSNKKNLKIKGINKAEVLIYNILGKKVLNVVFSKNESISLSRLKNGIYFVSIKSQKGTLNKKIIIK